LKTVGNNEIDCGKIIVEAELDSPDKKDVRAEVGRESYFFLRV